MSYRMSDIMYVRRCVAGVTASAANFVTQTLRSCKDRADINKEKLSTFVGLQYTKQTAFLTCSANGLLWPNEITEQNPSNSAP